MKKRRKDDDLKFYMTCDVCGRSHQFGPHFYDGKFIAAYQLQVCGTCFGGNWDGWASHLEPIVIAHLVQKGIPIPERRPDGLLPRGD